MIPFVEDVQPLPRCERPGPVARLAMDTAPITPAGEYATDDPVLVWCAGMWRPGEVEAVGEHAVRVRYDWGSGTLVDSFAAESVMRRTEDAR